MSSIALLNTGFPNVIRAMAARAPNVMVIMVGQEQLTWHELENRTNQVANRLIAEGRGKGDRVALFAHNGLDYICALLGAVKAGCSAVPLPILISSEALSGMLADSRSSILFVSASTVDVADEVLAATQDITRIGLDFENNNWQHFEGWISGASQSDPGVSLLPDDEFNIIYSSGTTGRPKGIRHSHAFRSGDAAELQELGFPQGGMTIITTALYSNWSIYALLATLQSGGSCVVMPRFDVGGFLDLCESHHPHNVFLVPIQVKRILADPTLAERQLGNMTTKWVAGSPMTISEKQAVMRQWPGGLMEIYGMTEGTPSTTLDARAHPDKLASVGRPGPGTILKILGPEDEEMPTGEIGEILGHGPSMMMGYNRLAETTRQLEWYDADGTVFFRSGDLGYLDGDGFLYVVGRAKDMIISGGLNIYPADLEALLLSHPFVQETAVIGVPSEKWGEQPLALVVCKEGADLDANALLEWANSRLGKVQRIAAVRFVDKLPRGNLGKVLKNVLRDRYADALVGAA